MSKKSNILVLTYWSYKDALIQTYTLPYVEMIRKNITAGTTIYMLTLEQPNQLLSGSEKKAVVEELCRSNIKLIFKKYHPFGIISLFSWVLLLIRLFFLIVFHRIKVIHAFCTPAGAAGYILSKLTGTKLIIDSFEPHAESMVENGSWSKDSFAFKLLFCLEKLQSKRANAFIATTAGMKQYAKEKYQCNCQRFFVKPACVDLQLFNPEKYANAEAAIPSFINKTTCIYAGKIGGIYLEEEIFAFFSAAYDYWKDDFRIIFLSSSSKELINFYLSKFSIPAKIIEIRFVAHQDIPLYMAQADFAINPVKPAPSKKYCTSIKDGEYWAMGLPVLISPDISDDSDMVVNYKMGAVVDFSDKLSIQKGIEEINRLLMSEKHELKSRIRNIAIKYRSYENAELTYKFIYKDKA